MIVVLGKKSRRCDLTSSRVKLKIKLGGVGQYWNCVKEFVLKNFMEIFETSLNSAENPAKLKI